MDIIQLSRHITEHQQWIDSRENSGTRLRLCGDTLSGLNLRGALLKRGQLQGTHLPCCDLSHANLEGACLQDAYLNRTNLYGAKLMGACLRGAHFHATNLSYADLRGADLRGTDLRNACLLGTLLPEKTWVIYGERYHIQITNGMTLRVGCQEHPLPEWRRFSKEEINNMDGSKALRFYPRLLDILDLFLGEGDRPEWASGDIMPAGSLYPHVAFGTA